MLSKPLRLSLAIAILSYGSAISIFAEQVSPRSVPPHFFNDYAGIVNPGTIATLNQKLADFERETSNQLVVVIYPKYTAKTSLEDYAQQVYRAWKVGQAGRDNGAILFVFVQDRKMRIHTGRGLEGALPDATCNRIMHDIAPYFRQQDFDGGLTAGVNAIITATKNGHIANHPNTAPAEKVVPDESLENASDLQVEQTTRDDAIEFYRRRQEKKLSTDISDSFMYSEGRAIKHGLSSSSMKGVSYISAFNSTIEQLRMDATNEETTPEKIKQPVRDLAFTSTTSLNEFTSDMDKNLDNMSGIFLIFLLVYIGFSVPIYFLPWIISMFNKHPSKVGIFFLNFFLGWTFVGWIIALVWACTKPQPLTQVIINQPSIQKETTPPPTPD